MTWLLIIAAVAIGVGAVLAMRRGMKGKARERLDEIRRKFGDTVLEGG